MRADIHSEPVVLSWSGGKDSSLALAALQADARYNVVALLTSVTSGYERVSIHGVRRSLVEAQAARLGLPLYEVNIEPQSSNQLYEAAFAKALGRIRAERPDVQSIAFGDLFLADVRAYREQQLLKNGFQSLFPLWGQDTGTLAAHFISTGFVATLVCVDTTQLAGTFAGRAFDQALLAELPPQVDPCGENGEFHTFVSAGPIFAEPIAVRTGDIVLRDERFAFCDLISTGD